MHRLAYVLTATVSGLLFGAGLYVSQMVDPLKVLRFLDFTAIPQGGWDPSLALVMISALAVMFVAVRYAKTRQALVMISALAVMFVAVRYAKTRQAPLFDVSFHESEFKRIDARLVGGSALFGVGWGMSGICPGPAITLIAFMPQNLLFFFVPMVIGSWLGSFIVPSGHDKRLAMAR